MLLPSAMCELLGMECNVPTDIVFSFTGLAARGGKKGPHGDGWGLALYEGRAARVFLEPAAAFASPLAAYIRENPIKTLLAVAHVRKRTRGRIALENTHPFQRELWGRHFVFAHNGTVKNVRRFPLGRYRPIGETDSEYAFCALLHRLDTTFPAYPRSPRAFWDAVAKIGGELGQKGTFNFLLGDGTHLFARCATKLHYLIRKAPFPVATLADEDVTVDFSQVTTLSDRVAVVATMPLTTNEHWETGVPGNLWVFRDGKLRATLPSSLFAPGARGRASSGVFQPLGRALSIPQSGRPRGMLPPMRPLRSCPSSHRHPLRAVLALPLSGLLGLFVASAVTPGCATSPAGALAGDPSTVKEAFGVRCDAVRAQEAPDLMAWDPAARANLDRLRKAGVVAVRYEAKGCDVKLELLPGCKGPSSYKYSAYAARETKSARDANEVFASLPLGAQSVAGKVSKGKMLRTDYVLVGTDSLRADVRVARASLRGPDCARATHVVNTVYLGGFAMEAGASAELSGQATVFGVGAGASSAHSSERLAREGDAAACEEALKSGKETALCSVPLRVGLLALDGLASDGSGVAAGSQATSAGPGNCPDGLIPVEGGAFVMGAQKQRVDVAPFCIEKTEVTSGAYAACVASGKCRAPAESDKPLCNFRKDGRDGHPMNCVTYDEAKMECQARGLLLPTEQQWEWAARGNGQRTFPWGEDQELDRACVDRGKDGGTCEASAHPKGATPSGVLGLAGNVAEWVELRTGNPGNAGGDWSDKSLRDLEPRRRNLSATATPKIGYRCVTR